MSEMLKIFSVQNMQHQCERVCGKKVQFSKDFRTDGTDISKMYNYFFLKKLFLK